MQKFTVVAMNLAQSMPNRVKNSPMWSSCEWAAYAAPHRHGLLAQEQRVERDGLGERHADDADGEDFAERAGVATHGLRCAKTRQTYTNRRAQTCEGDGEVTRKRQFC